MATAALLLAAAGAAAAAAAAPTRQVSWYMPRRSGEATVAWLDAYSHKAWTGVYLCCSGFSVAANGSATAPPAALLRNETSAIVAAGGRVHYVASISNVSIATGSWRSGGAVPTLVAAAAAGGFHGYIVDYEPSTNYTAAHAAAYAAFLTALADGLHGAGLELGWDSAGWGILNPASWPIYASVPGDIVTSMSPTYFNVPTSRPFLLGEVAAGIPQDRKSVV